MASLSEPFLFPAGGILAPEASLIKGRFGGIVYVLSAKGVAFCKDAVFEGCMRTKLASLSEPFLFPAGGILAKSQTNDYLRGSHRESFFVSGRLPMQASHALKQKKLLQMQKPCKSFVCPFAERTRFELVVRNNPYVGLANRWFQPLTHLSVTFVDRFYPKGCANIGCFLE